MYVCINECIYVCMNECIVYKRITVFFLFCLYEQVGFELSLGAGDFFVSDVVAEAHQVVQGVPHGVIQLVVRGHQVDSKETSVLREKPYNECCSRYHNGILTVWVPCSKC